MYKLIIAVAVRHQLFFQQRCVITEVVQAVIIDRRQLTMQENGTMIETMNSIPIAIGQGIAQTLLRSVYMQAVFRWIANGIQGELKKKTAVLCYRGLVIIDVTLGMFRMRGRLFLPSMNIKENYCGGKEIIITSPDEIEVAIANNLIQAGDLLYFKAGTALHHSVIITKVTNNMIYYAGHTDSCFDKPLNEGMRTDSVVILHLQE